MILVRYRILKLTVCVLIVLPFFCSCSDRPLTPSYEHTTYTLQMKDNRIVSDKDWVVTVEKEPGRDFVILNLTDIQLGTGQFLANFDHIRNMVTALVEKTRPDMITFTGDMSYGCGTAIYGICSFLDSFGIPWAPVYGNHDLENSGMSPDTMALVLENYSNCLFRNGPECLAVDPKYNVEKKGNYIVNVVEKQGDSFEAVKSLVFFNTGTKGLSQLQLSWYQDCMDSINRYGKASTVSSAVFMHIPLYEYRYAAYEAYRDYNATLMESYTEEAWNEGYRNSFGTCHEGISSASNKPGYADILKAKGNDLVACGHNHTNCFCIDYDGMTYLFTLKTGPGCYYEEGMEGGTEISIDGNGNAHVRHCFFYEGYGCFYTPQIFD